MKFAVTYEETLARIVVVEADSYKEAEGKVLDAIEREEIVLDADDYLSNSGIIAYIENITDEIESYYKDYEHIY